MFMGAFGTLITHKLQQKELLQLVLTLHHSSAIMPLFLSFRNSFWCPLVPGVPSPSPARLPHSPRCGSCVLKPKVQTQPPPSTNARLARPIIEIAADCCACGQRFSLLGNFHQNSHREPLVRLLACCGVPLQQNHLYVYSSSRASGPKPACGYPSHLRADDSSALRFCHLCQEVKTISIIPPPQLKAWPGRRVACLGFVHRLRVFIIRSSLVALGCGVPQSSALGRISFFKTKHVLDSFFRRRLLNPNSPPQQKRLLVRNLRLWLPTTFQQFQGQNEISMKDKKEEQKESIPRSSRSLCSASNDERLGRAPALFLLLLFPLSSRRRRT